MMTMQLRNLSRRRSGAAILVVMTILALITTFLLCNSTLLDGLKRELRLVEEKQKKKFNQPPTPSATAKPSPSR